MFDFLVDKLGLIVKADIPLNALKYSGHGVHFSYRFPSRNVAWYRQPLLIY